ncbi:MAG: outer membrane protein transport protein [Alphaproteobacteria bacterium]|nr:outer membrane protein transport protein [Alphaproteobacteria bacterium]
MPVLLLALLPGAEAAGYYLADPGVRSFSRGLAFVAGVDDLSAQYYNPAGLIRLRGGHVRFDMAGAYQSVTFNRADEPDNDLTFDPIVNDAPPYPIPSIGVSHDFGLERFTFAFGLYPPYAPDITYPADGPQRYTLIESIVVQTQVGPSAAFRPHPWITLGAGVNWQLLIAGQTLVLTTDDPAGDIGFDMRATDPFKISWNAGLLVGPPSERVVVGASIQPPIQFNGRGYLEGDFTNHALYRNGIITDATTRDDDISLSVRMPLVLRAGVSVRPIEPLEIELAGVLQRWSTMDDIVVDDLQLTVQNTFAPTTITDPVVLPAEYDDAWSLRLGGDFDINDRWTARAGTFYETSAVPTRRQNVSLPDAPKIGYGAGGSAHLGRRFTIDAGWSQAFLLIPEITDSEVTQIKLDINGGDVEDGKVVGNGEYRSRILLFGASIDVAFSLPDNDAPPP